MLYGSGAQDYVSDMECRGKGSAHTGIYDRCYRIIIYEGLGTHGGIDLAYAGLYHHTFPAMIAALIKCEPCSSFFFYIGKLGSDTVCLAFHCSYDTKHGFILLV